MTQVPTPSRAVELEYYPDIPDWLETQDLKKVLLNVPGLGRRSLVQCLYQLKDWSRQLNACCHYCNPSFPSTGYSSVFAFAHMYKTVSDFFNFYQTDPRAAIQAHVHQPRGG